MDNSKYLQYLNQFIKSALKEDVGDGDHSTLSCIGKKARGKAILKIKDTGIIAGIDVARHIFQYLEKDAVLNLYKKDGDPVKQGDIAFEVQASIHAILKAERLVLNCMQRMSGIATLTHTYVSEIKNYHTKLLDTRKTTPNFRLLEKEAVKIGGGYNHRFGLYDMIMLKDNHIDYCGGITKALNKAWDYVQNKKPGIKIEVETRNLKEVKEAVSTGKADRIMLDNFSPSEIIEALIIINKTCETEASGGITLKNIQAYAATGVDFISSGAIIHQAQSLDLSLKAEIN
ncbi:MAG: carboxylating nicotinate-nucleotide diphosphorylase [Bacteroidetes bacterium]|nr:carboxylating nicotinate-nucleotide diphosphorylase [Bacteroidota bacterium]